jgi:hypothetical protein
MRQNLTETQQHPRVKRLAWQDILPAPEICQNRCRKILCGKSLGRWKLLSRISRISQISPISQIRRKPVPAD